MWGHVAVNYLRWSIRILSVKYFTFITEKRVKYIAKNVLFILTLLLYEIIAYAF